MTALNMAVAQTETCATLTSSELSVVAWALAKLPQVWVDMREKKSTGKEWRVRYF